MGSTGTCCDGRPDDSVCVGGNWVQGLESRCVLSAARGCASHTLRMLRAVVERRRALKGCKAAATRLLLDTGSDAPEAASQGLAADQVEITLPALWQLASRVALTVAQPATHGRAVHQ